MTQCAKDYVRDARGFPTRLLLTKHKQFVLAMPLDSIGKNNHDFLPTIWIAGARQYSPFLQFTIHQNFVV